MKKWIAIVSISSSMVALPVVAETLDGTKILEMEAEKARQIEDLEYQARLIEQKAKLAKAYKELKESGGFIPGEEGEGLVAPGANPSPKANAGGASEKLGRLPELKSISGGQAVFLVNGKTFRGVSGSQLPGGFKVLSVSDTNGVRLAHGGSVYSLDINWTSAHK